MANHKSAKKRIRQTIRRRQVNNRSKSRLRVLEKTLRQAIEKKDKSKATELLKVFNRAMDRSIHTVGLHQNKVSRKKSRLTLMTNTIS